MNLELEITDIYRNCCDPDWDGYGAAPVTPEATENAIRFVKNFPEFFEDRDIEITPDNCGLLIIDIYNKDATIMLSFNFTDDPLHVPLYVIPN
jgi:hypothetical protein